MQETHYPDGTFERKYYTAATQAEMAEKLRSAYDEAMGKGATEIRQKMMDPKHPCPCGSGMKFGRCCAKKIQVSP